MREEEGCGVWMGVCRRVSSIGRKGGRERERTGEGEDGRGG